MKIYKPKKLVKPAILTMFNHIINNKIFNIIYENLQTKSS
jgi:hypothetical protein